MARADLGFSQGIATDFFLDVFRQLVQVGQLNVDHFFCIASSKSGFRLASTARFDAGTHGMESARREQRNHFLLLLPGTQFRNSLRKILNRKERALPVDGGDADRGQPRIQNIFPVPRRIHPAVMNRLRRSAIRDVFGNDAEMRASFREPAFEVRFVRQLVFEQIQVRHAEGVFASGFEKSLIPVQYGKALRGTFLVEKFKKLALRIVALELRVRGRQKKKQQREGQKKFGLSHSEEGFSREREPR